LQRFKWGIGRILMETPRIPTIIPMWITGFDKLMPEGRRAPWRFFPRPGASLGIRFGAPLPEASVLATLGLGSGVRGSWRDDAGDGGYVKEGRWQR